MSIERIEPGTAGWSAYYANHINRYMFALQQIDRNTPARLLDAACGVGYGTQFLANHTQCHSTGVDINTHALDIANRQFRTPNTDFLLDDCTKLNNAASKGLYDYVVSFETFEHLSEPEAFLESTKKVMKPGGKVILSTPNINVSSPGSSDGKVAWEFHEKEYTPAEFYGMIDAAGFKNIQFYGQQYTTRGKLKSELMGDLHQLWSNPFMRAGRWIQQVFRGRKFEPLMKESIEDFEIVPYGSPADCDALKTNGPFVQIIVAEK
ncbi:class I SAM-dependent methyltransferase [Paraflavitalea pollutisoli]|uniref:class I SAM-dependent methyltransferase n=1 Tax=Paraflavitalea pollutisoli TaxID=3034143 RepID=UPI0023EBF295|nr:class I SAM-dependent methyltransferase [Paraflavitalea sp. H1-2-19X]